MLSLIFLTPQMVNMRKLKEKCMGVRSTELVTAGQTHVDVEVRKTVTFIRTHCSKVHNIDFKADRKAEKID